MSANLKYSKSKRTSFCKVCKDAGKDESVYTAHNIRNERNKVVCPLLLSQSCFKCTALGHTPKYCPQGKIDEKNQKRREYKERRSSHEGSMCDSRSASYFGVLCVETTAEVEAEAKTEVKVEVAPVPVRPPSYASVVLRTPAPIQAPIIKPQPAAPKIVVEKKLLSWADCVSSDDDDEEEEFEEEDYDY